MIERTLTTFGTAERNFVEHSLRAFMVPDPPMSYDMLFKDSVDGCARYDDVWGG